MSGGWSPKQKLVIATVLDDVHDTIVVSGPVQSGKSASVCASFFGLCSVRYSGEDFISANRSQRQWSGANLKYGRRFADTQRVTFKRSGEPYVMASAAGPVANNYYPLIGNHAGAADKARSFSAAGSHIDEATLVPDDFRDSVGDRNSRRGAKIVLSTNPASEQHPIYVELHDAAHTKGSGVAWIDFELADNPGLSKSYLRRLERRYTGAQYQRMVLGLWVGSEGQVWPEFRHRATPAPGDVAYYVLGVDWGHSTWSHAVLVAYHGDGNATVAGEWAWNGRDRGQLDEAEQASRIGDWLRRAMPGEQRSRPLGKLRRCWVDPTATGMAKGLADELPCPVRLADSDVSDGVQLVRNRFESGRLAIDRDAAPVLWGQARRYEYDERYGDRPLAENDHGPDALRYVVWNESGRGDHTRIIRKRPR